MAVYLQPCDWREQDKDKKQIVDVQGRTNEGDVARLRVTGFRPFFYLRAKDGETASSVQTAIAINFGKPINGIKITAEQKLDAMRGFSGLQPTKVWKISTPSLWLHKALAKELRSGKKLGNRFVQREDLQEANLPPYLKLFHELDLSPASPIRFEGDLGNPEDDRVDVAYEVHYSQIKPYASLNIPLQVASQDIETYSSTGLFPVATNPGDEIMQIGVSFRWSDQMLDTVARQVLVSGTVEASKDPSVTFIACSGEQGLLLKFQQLLHSENPDILCGYNTFGFDDSQIAERAEFHKIELQLGRSDTKQWGSRQEFVKTERKTFELASGKYAVRYFDLPGRLPIDLLLSVRREQNLDSYKLDNVANTFLRDKVTKIVILTGAKTQQQEIHTKSTRGLFVGNLVRFDFIGHTINPYAEGHKFHVISVSPKSFVIETDFAGFDMDSTNLYWSFAKDDITAKQMFSAHKGTAAERAVVAKYCIQDCDLVLTLMAKLDTLVNARGMADVCRVPIDFIFLRGQGIKIYSAVAYNASKRNQIIMEQESAEGDTSYEGAIVLPPKIGLYLDQPIPVLDFNSLYPSNMIAFNLSPDTLVQTKTYDHEGNKLKHEGIDGSALTELKTKFKIDEVSFDTKNEEGIATGRITCGQAQPTEDPNSVGILPLTLDILLKKRKETRKMMETTEDDAQKAVLNGLQLAYKVVANSVQGQTGSRTSPIRKMEVAACTTAAGRERLQFAKTIVESEFGGKVVQGDTDSIFIQFPTKDLVEAMELGKKSAERITSLCRRPYKIEQEKTFYPFILFCRKRQVGMMQEDDPKHCKRKSMGIALKRRDNAPIVKDVFGGALDILMEDRDLKKAQKFVQTLLTDVIQNKMPLEKQIITKQLRDDYVTEVPIEIRKHNSKHKPEVLNELKAPFATIKKYAEEFGLPLPDSSIAHRKLADRMEGRDKGNAPQVGDRLAFVYVEKLKDAKKQGDRIEHQDYAKEKKLKPDVEFYITNQIQNPVSQLFALGIEQLEGYRPTRRYSGVFDECMEKQNDEEEATLATLKLKEKELESILFLKADYMLKAMGKPIQKRLDSYFRK